MFLEPFEPVLAIEAFLARDEIENAAALAGLVIAPDALLQIDAK
jgi:hypothetical protein